MINAIVLVIPIITSLFLIVFILLHSGKGGGLSDMFGGSATLSGGTTAERNLDKLTIATAIVFALCTVWLSLKWK